MVGLQASTRRRALSVGRGVVEACCARRVSPPGAPRLVAGGCRCVCGWGGVHVTTVSELDVGRFVVAIFGLQNSRRFHQACRSGSRPSQVAHRA